MFWNRLVFFQGTGWTGFFLTLERNRPGGVTWMKDLTQCPVNRDKQVSLQLIVAHSRKGNMHVSVATALLQCLLSDNTQTSCARVWFPNRLPHGSWTQDSTRWVPGVLCDFLYESAFVSKHLIAFSLRMRGECETLATLSPLHQGAFPLIFLVQETYIGSQQDLWPTTC